MGTSLIKKKPEISVIITAYNRDQYLEQCVNSVINQNIAKDLYEIIIIKNFKSPVDRMADAENIIIMHSDVRELGPKLHAALNKSNGNIIAFMEDDDLWDAHKLETVLKKFQGDSDLGFYHNAYKVIDGDGKLVSFSSAHRDFQFEELNDIFVWKNGNSFNKLNRMRRARVFFNMSCISIRKDVILRYSLELQELNFSPDFFVFFSALCSDMEIMADNLPLTFYRRSNVNSHFVSTPTKASTRQIDWQVKDRQLSLKMSEKFGSRSAKSMAKFELADFLTIRFIRQFMKNEKRSRKDVVNLFRENRHLTGTLLFQLRYFYKNLVMLMALIISPKLARRLWSFRSNGMARRN